MTKHIRITAQEIADAIGEPVICADYEDGTTESAVPRKAQTMKPTPELATPDERADRPGYCPCGHVLDSLKDMVCRHCKRWSDSMTKTTPEFATAHELLLETQRARAKNHAQALEAVISMLEYTIAREWGAGLFVVHGNYEAPLTRALQELRKAQKEFESFYRNGADR